MLGQKWNDNNACIYTLSLLRAITKGNCKDRIIVNVNICI